LEKNTLPGFPCVLKLKFQNFSVFSIIISTQTIYINQEPYPQTRYFHSSCCCNLRCYFLANFLSRMLILHCSEPTLADFFLLSPRFSEAEVKRPWVRGCCIPVYREPPYNTTRIEIVFPLFGIRMSTVLHHFILTDSISLFFHCYMKLFILARFYFSIKN
jgi:hypothetical protein